MARRKQEGAGRAAAEMRKGWGTSSFLLALLLLLAFFFTIQTVRFVEPLGMDQGLFAAFGRWVPQGALPYRDIWDSKPPLILYTYPLAFLLTGGGREGLWLFEGAWLLLTGLAGYFLARRLWGRWAGLGTATSLLLILWSAGLEGYTSRSQAEEFLALPLLLAAWTALRAEERPWWALASGVLLGIAGLYKVPALLVAAAWPLAWWPSRGWRGAAARTLLAAAGAVLPWLAAAGWFAAHGAFEAFIDAVLVYNRSYAAVISEGVPFSTILADFVGRVGPAVPTSLVAGAAGLCWGLWRREKTTLWLGAWLALAVAAVLFQRQIAGYHCLLLATPLALVAGRGVAAAAGGGAPRLLALPLLLALLIAGALEARSWNAIYGRDLALISGRIDRDRYLRSFQVGPFSPLTEARAAAYLRSRTPADRRILVWGLSPGIYVLADRRPATRFPFHHLLLTDAPLSRAWGNLSERRRAFIARLEQEPPAFVLVGTGDRNGFEPLDSRTQMLRFPELRNLLARDYEQVDRIDNFLVFAEATR